MYSISSNESAMTTINDYKYVKFEYFVSKYIHSQEESKSFLMIVLDVQDVQEQKWKNSFDFFFWKFCCPEHLERA